MEYAFGTAADGEPLGDAFALIREDEGVTVIRPGKGWARITLGVHSSLAALGLTARVAEALAGQGISANMIAACHHDHVFVQWDRREDAVSALRALSSR